jgi:hypothetical protein
MLAQYVQAFTGSPPEILHRRLIPFSVGHAYLLEAAGNGFAPTANGGSIDDLVVAVQVCTRSFRDAVRFLQGVEFFDADAWAKECADCSLEFEAEKFRAYTDAALTIPPRWKKKEQGQCRAPWPLQILAGLAGEAAMTRATVDDLMNTPLAEAFALLAARQSWQGDDSLMTEEEIDAIAMLKPDEENVAS